MNSNVVKPEKLGTSPLSLSLYSTYLKSWLYFFFWAQYLLMDKIIKNKKGLELVTSCSSVYITSSEKIPLLVMYYLTKFDDVMYNSFCAIPKITSANSCKPIHNMINYSTSMSLWIWKVWNRREKNYKNLNILRLKKTFLMK